MSCRDTGFTLIEVLVALALTALVSVLLLHGIGLAVAGLDRHTRQAERLDDRRSLDELLRRVLGAATAGGFAGRPDGVRFLSLAEDGGPGFYRVDIVRSGRKVILRRRLAGPSGDPHVAESVLAAEATDFRLAYFGATAAADEPAWHDSWEGLAAPPRAVRMILDTAGGPPRPPLVVPIRNAGS